MLLYGFPGPCISYSHFNVVNQRNCLVPQLIQQTLCIPLLNAVYLVYKYVHLCVWPLSDLLFTSRMRVHSFQAWATQSSGWHWAG
jgi:hypothetical protein